MVIFKIDVLRGFSSDAHGPSPRVTLQTVEPVSRNIHVLRLHCHFQRLKNTHALPDIARTDPASLACEVDLFKPFISEAGDHFLL